MKAIKIYFFLFLSLYLSTEIFAQNNFQKGYYINNNGNVIECLILNEDWKSSPSIFKYKISEGQDVNTASIENVSVFEINGALKYERHEVLIARNLKDLTPTQNNSELDFKKETLFLKVLVEGDVNLYQYEDGSLKIFFIENPETEKVEQLEFKAYANTENKVLYNNKFRTQLYKYLNPANIDKESIRDLDYYRKELINIVELSNGNTANTFVNKSTDLKSKLNLYAKAGFGLSSLYFEGPIANQNITFDDQVIPRFGIEIEYILSFNNNKWSVFTTPIYQNYKADSFFIIAEGLPSESRRETKVEYNSIELPVGIRHYFFLNNSSRLYLNAAIVFDANLNSTIESTGSNPFDIRSGANFSAGIGYQYKNYGIEFLYFSERNLLDRYLGSRADYNALAFQLSYKLF